MLNVVVAECHVLFIIMLSVVILNVITLNVIMLMCHYANVSLC